MHQTLTQCWYLLIEILFGNLKLANPEGVQFCSSKRLKWIYMMKAISIHNNKKVNVVSCFLSCKGLSWEFDYWSCINLFYSNSPIWRWELYFYRVDSKPKHWNVVVIFEKSGPWWLIPLTSIKVNVSGFFSMDTFRIYLTELQFIGITTKYINLN